MRPDWLRFPATVNEKAARVVATGVVAQAALFLATRWTFLLVTLAFGFAARVVAGPTFSPLARLAVHVLAPRLGPARTVAGSPKRFAQGVGLAFSTVALVAWLAGSSALAVAVLVMLIGAASLEAGLGFCLGCWVYGHLVRLRVLPAAACVECADITLRRRPTAA
jgi:Domain of unknown function (DUF4395)